MSALLPHAPRSQLLHVHRLPQHRLSSRPQPPQRLLCRADAATRSLQQAVRVKSSTNINCKLLLGQLILASSQPAGSRP